MSARTPTRTRTRTHATVGTTGSAGVDVRLPWWGVALPVAAFAVLFLLITGPGSAQATGGEPAGGRILEQIQITLAR
ncbi:hypothetical protein [Streptomyces sp. TRM49041]|uniref:hypothetical protein n=1 Tax=Streptomyces sp. TRM49041 TaxID=2603216 RepID=UPI0011EE0977|nr:hypothetical protein [Streptomyces sp. TRM49041]